MEWKLAQAKQQFSEVVRAAEREPQIILNRDRRVAVLVTAAEFDDYLAWKSSRAKGSFADAIDELVSICREEGATYDAPPRADRPNPLAPPKRKKRAR